MARYPRGANLIAREQDGALQYYLHNAHGDVTERTDNLGTVLRRYKYDAFGNEQNPEPLDSNPFRFCGEYFDAESGEIYLRARYYDPRTGRFDAEDSARDGLNWYTYCNGNPVTFVDFTGNKPIPGSIITTDDWVFYGKNGKTFNPHPGFDENNIPYEIGVEHSADWTGLYQYQIDTNIIDRTARIIFHENAHTPEAMDKSAWVLVNRVMRNREGLANYVTGSTTYEGVAKKTGLIDVININPDIGGRQFEVYVETIPETATDPKGWAAENGLSENWSRAEELSKMIVSLLGDPNLSADAVYDTLTKWIGNPWEGTEYEQYSREFDRWYADSKGPYFGSFSNSKRKDRY